MGKWMIDVLLMKYAYSRCIYLSSLHSQFNSYITLKQTSKLDQSTGHTHNIMKQKLQDNLDDLIC